MVVARSWWSDDVPELQGDVSALVDVEGALDESSGVLVEVVLGLLGDGDRDTSRVESEALALEGKDDIAVGGGLGRGVLDLGLVVVDCK